LFFADPAIKALPDRVGAILHEVRAQSLLPAGEKDAGAAELEAAHRQAHSFVNDVLKKNVKLSVATSSLVVAYDKEARIFCASTSEVLNKVRWIHQPVAHALYAALIPEIILAHEYLSHLAPKNPHLGNVITEEWLVVALMQSFQGEAGKPGQKKWKNTVWFLQRNAIMKHLDALLKADPEAQRKTAEPALESHIYGVYEFAFLLYGRSRAAFWKLTGLFLKARNDIDTKTIESLMKKMVAEQDSWLDFLEAGKWNKLKYLISR
jgi:hypothetical protein